MHILATNQDLHSTKVNYYIQKEENEWSREKSYKHHGKGNSPNAMNEIVMIRFPADISSLCKKKVATYMRWDCFLLPAQSTSSGATSRGTKTDGRKQSKKQNHSSGLQSLASSRTYSEELHGIQRGPEVLVDLHPFKSTVFLLLGCFHREGCRIWEMWITFSLAHTEANKSQERLWLDSPKVVSSPSVYMLCLWNAKGSWRN